MSKGGKINNICFTTLKINSYFYRHIGGGVTFLTTNKNIIYE